jgi:DUF4097 and DUF4098 domain-containing protein YvlB
MRLPHVHFGLLLLGMLAATFVPEPLRAADGRFDQTFPVSTPFKLDITTDAGDISLRAGDPGKIEIHARLHNIDDSEDDDTETRIHAIELDPPIDRDPKGHNARIGHFADPNLVRNVSITYEIVVPAETQLHSETGTGDQTVEGIRGPVDAGSGSGKLHIWHVGNDTHVSTGSGEIDLRDVNGEVRAKAGTGPIYASDIRADVTMGIITGSGDVDVENQRGGLQVTSGSGNIRATGNPASDWQLDTGAGTVRVQFSVGANVTLIAHTSSGIIESTDAVTVQGNKNPHDLYGQIGRGGATVDLRTASGNIEIK